MLSESDLGAKFSRPSSMALIAENYLVCKCEQENNSLYRFKNDGNGKLTLLEKVYIRESLLFIKSGTKNIFFGVGSCGTKLYFYDPDLNLLGSYAFQLGSKITTINYDKKLQKLFIALSIGDSLSSINVCSLNGELDVYIEKIYEIATGNISGLLYIDPFTFIISDFSTNNIYFYNTSNAQKKIFAHFGREGNGYVRAPGILAQIDNYFVVIDRDNYLIQFYSLQGIFKGQIGGKGTSINSFDLPLDIVSDGDLLIVADMNNDRLLTYKYSNETWVGCLGFARSYLPGQLSRPISIRYILNKIYIADRSNGRVQVFDENLKYVSHYPTNPNLLFKQPISLCYLEIESKYCMAVLSRNSNAAPPAISIIDIQKGNEILHKELPELSDPQGMVECGSEGLCVMDTLNRRAVLYDRNLNLILERNLAELSQFNQFLCRLPSIVDGQLYFCDYHNGNVVVLDNEFNHLKTFSIDMSRLRMSNIRKIEKVGQHFLVIGRGEEELAIIFNNLFFGEIHFFKKSIFSSVADVCFSSKGDVYFLLKERDTVLKYSMNELFELIG